eukprot:GHVU01046928.1.p1 GENE.GHVU01046928.1~~GHVU01046928.1.p1  ORF type:complete len:697 (-),score=29.97 GHVU01046928.1:197-2287(-)
MSFLDTREAKPPDFPEAHIDLVDVPPARTRWRSPAPPEGSTRRSRGGVGTPTDKRQWKREQENLSPKRRRGHSHERRLDSSLEAVIREDRRGSATSTSSTSRSVKHARGAREDSRAPEIEKRTPPQAPRQFARSPERGVSPGHGAQAERPRRSSGSNQAATSYATRPQPSVAERMRDKDEAPRPRAHKGPYDHLCWRDPPAVPEGVPLWASGINAGLCMWIVEMNDLSVFARTTGVPSTELGMRVEFHWFEGPGPGEDSNVVQPRTPVPRSWVRKETLTDGTSVYHIIRSAMPGDTSRWFLKGQFRERLSSQGSSYLWGIYRAYVRRRYRERGIVSAQFVFRFWLALFAQIEAAQSLECLRATCPEIFDKGSGLQMKGWISQIYPPLFKYISPDDWMTRLSLNFTRATWPQLALILISAIAVNQRAYEGPGRGMINRVINNQIIRRTNYNFEHPQAPILQLPAQMAVMPPPSTTVSDGANVAGSVGQQAGVASESKPVRGSDGAMGTEGPEEERLSKGNYVGTSGVPADDEGGNSDTSISSEERYSRSNDYKAFTGSDRPDVIGIAQGILSTNNQSTGNDGTFNVARAFEAGALTKSLELQTEGETGSPRLEITKEENGPGDATGSETLHLDETESADVTMTSPRSEGFGITAGGQSGMDEEDMADAKNDQGAPAEDRHSPSPGPPSPGDYRHLAG